MYKKKPIVVSLSANRKKRPREEFYNTIQEANQRYQKILDTEKYTDEIVYDRVGDKIRIMWWELL